MAQSWATNETMECWCILLQGRVHEILKSGKFCIKTAKVNIGDVIQRNAKIVLRKAALRVTTYIKKKLAFLRQPSKHLS